MVGAGGALYTLTGNQHVFAIDDPDISYPNLPDTISIGVVAVVAVVVPAIIIVVLSFFLVIASAFKRIGFSGQLLQRAVWESNAGLLGLAVSIAGAFFLTQGLKDISGQPRPDFLARCVPDLTKLGQGVQSGYGGRLEEAYSYYNSTICTQTDTKFLNDGFAAFPSGHSSISWAGMLYLTLWLAAKLGLNLPRIPAATPQIQDARQQGDLTRASAAAPPIWSLVLTGIPVSGAFYIATSRYADYHHFAFDIISGSLIGIFFALLGYYMYQIPHGRGSGWAWGPRSNDRAFCIGLGTSSYVDTEARAQQILPARRDLESGGQAGSLTGLRDGAQTNPVDIELRHFNQ